MLAAVAMCRKSVAPMARSDATVWIPRCLLRCPCHASNPRCFMYCFSWSALELIVDKEPSRDVDEVDRVVDEPSRNVDVL
eukprot:SAG25_NODE_8013_length_445_cov_1.193642_2_plen_79_part_01